MEIPEQVKVFEDESNHIKKSESDQEAITASRNQVESKRIISVEKSIDLLDQKESSIKFDKEKDSELEVSLKPAAIKKDLKDESEELKSEIICIELFESILDTAQSFKIFKFVLREETVQTLSSMLPEKFKIIGAYGDTNTILFFIEKLFQKKLPQFHIREGIFFFQDTINKTCVLAFFTEDTMLYSLRPIKTSCRITNIVKILSDLCYKIVACISGDIIDKWYFENDGKINPFIPKIHRQGGSSLKNIKVQESSLQQITLKSECQLQKACVLPKDNTQWIFQWSSEEISQEDIRNFRNKVDEFCQGLTKIAYKYNVPMGLNAKFHDFQNSTKIFSIDSEKLKNSIREELEKLIDMKNNAKKLLVKDILYEISTKFNFQQKNISSYYGTGYYYSNSLDSLGKDFSYYLENATEITLSFINDKLKKIQHCLENKNRFIDNLEKYSNEYILLKNNEEEVKRFFKKFFLSFRENVSYKEVEISFFSDKILRKGIAEFKKKLKKENITNYKQFLKLFNEHISPFINKCEVSLDLIVQPNYEKYTNEIALLNDNFRAKCFSILKILEVNFNGIEIALTKSIICLSQDIGKYAEIKCKIEGSSQLFKKFFKTRNVKVSQIISLEPDVCFILISNKEDSATHIIRFNPKYNIKEDFDTLNDIPDPDIHIAWGSSANKYIMILNTKKECNQGSLKQNKYFEKGRNLNIFEKVDYIVNSCYTRRLRKFYILSDDGKLFYRDMILDESDLCMIKSNSFDESKEDEESKWLNPKDGTKYIDFEVSGDESVFILRSETNIECFDSNFIQTHTLKLEDNFLNFKTVCIDNECYLIQLLRNNSFTCTKIIIPKEETQIESSKKIATIIAGNPILDVWHVGMIKFGQLTEETQIIKGDRIIGYFTIGEDHKKIGKYFSNLKEVRNAYEIKGFIDPKKFGFKEDKIIKKDFIFALCSRTPLHIASIQSGNLIPLQNGINNFDEFTSKLCEENFLDSLTDYIKFGNLEKVLEEFENIFVISIIGRQSSGKSYLLNRLTGTRFDVAAERCTDGIWMGIGKILDKNIIVFDCEGLFTVERSTQEEIKLCLFLSSLSDLIILNSDLSSGKHIKSLFDEFASGVDRLKGKKLFKGVLDITYRDIPDNQEDGAKIEFNRFLQNLLETGRKETLLKLFKRDILNSLYHNFENRLFDEEIEYIRKEYIENIEGKWDSGSELLLMMKTILAQIFSDDSVSADLRLFNTKTRKIKKLIEEIITNKQRAIENLPDKVFKGEIIINETKMQVELSIRDFNINESDPLLFFYQGMNLQKNIALKREFHNEWFNQLDKIIKLFFIERKILITDYFRNKIPRVEEFNDQIDLEVLYFEQKLDRISNNFTLCLRKCKICEVNCTKMLYHDSECSCNTDHICPMSCSICQDYARCNLLNGHKFKHFCGISEHKCTEKCKIGSCERICTLPPGHEESCRCSMSHPCNQECKMFDQCGQKCQIDLTVSHTDHDCISEKCPFQCFFNDGKICCVSNHFHDCETKIEIFNLDGKLIKLHLCGTAHPCQSECSLKGVCSIMTKPSLKVYKNKYNEFTYTYVDLEAEKQKCKIKIEKNKIAHLEDVHICSKTEHTCDQRCPDCNCFCDLIYGHEGLHKSGSHRNKECSEYISAYESFEDVYVENEKRTTVTIVSGESASPEICDQYCIRKDRGHMHPMPCKGELSCLETTDKGFAIHSKTQFVSATGKHYEYDLVGCDTYWRKLGWIPPVETINPDSQRLFSKCNFACGHYSHTERGEKSLCEGQLFHSLSTSYADHNFRCVHEGSGNNDIVFLIDRTGSMGSYFPEVKKVINNLIMKWGSETNRFAIVGFTDHEDSSGLPEDNPVCIFPTSKSLENGDPSGAMAYISSLPAGGGGGHNGEASIDALYAANCLDYRKNTGKMYILVTDDSPQGDEFLSGTAFPEGCPCKLEWRKLLDVMKANKTEFIFVKLHQRLNKTVELFKAYYGKLMTELPLNRVSEFEEKVTKIVISTLESSYVFSTKLRK